MSEILRGSIKALFGIDVLRKLCNHPDLATSIAIAPDYSNPEVERPHLRSGKMKVTAQLLQLWHGALSLVGFCLRLFLVLSSFFIYI